MIQQPTYDDCRHAAARTRHDQAGPDGRGVITAATVRAIDWLAEAAVMLGRIEAYRRAGLPVPRGYVNDVMASIGQASSLVSSLRDEEDVR